MPCPYGAYYVGKTKRQRAIRILEPVHAEKIGFFKTIIGHHIALDHNYNFGGLSFLPLAVISRDDRGGDCDRVLLQMESKWIFKSQAHNSPGLYDSLSYAPFL